MSKQTAWSLLMAVFMIAIMFMLVRPGSPAAGAVKDVSDALAGMIGTAINGLPTPAATPSTSAKQPVTTV
jgi:hypothetical protein